LCGFEEIVKLIIYKYMTELAPINYYLAISGFFNCITSVCLGIFIFIRNPRNHKNFSFFVLMLTVAFWSFGYAFWQLSREAAVALFWMKILVAGVILITPTFLQSTYSILGRLNNKNKKILLFCYLISICFEIFNAKALLYSSINPHYNLGFWPSPTYYFNFFLIFWICLLIYAFYLLIKLRPLFSDIEKRRIDYFIIGSIICFLGGISNWPNWYKIYCPPVLTPLVSIGMVIYAYAIIRYRLFDITIVIRKGIAYSLLVTLITLLYLLFVFIGEKFLQGLMGYRSLFVSIISACAIAILFNPLRSNIQNFIDKYFFKGTLESLSLEHEKLREQLFHTEKLAYVGKLASSIVHEIKNPLTAIKTYTEYLPQKYQDPKFREKFQSLIPREIERINQVVHQLLDLSKPRKPILKTIELTCVIDSTVLLLENNFKKKNISIKKTIIQMEF